MGQIAAAWEGGGECCKEYSHEHSQNDWAKPQRPAAVTILRMFCELQRIVTEHSLKNVMTVGIPLLHRIGGSMVEQRKL